MFDKMFYKFDSNSLVFKLLTILSILGHMSCLNITQMSVQSVAMAPEPVKLTCDKQDDNDNDTFEYIEWHKLVDNQWKLVKRYPLPSPGIVYWFERQTHSLSSQWSLISDQWRRTFHTFLKYRFYLKFISKRLLDFRITSMRDFLFASIVLPYILYEYKTRVPNIHII